MSVSIGDTISKLNRIEQQVADLSIRLERLEGLQMSFLSPLKDPIEVIGEWRTTSNTEKVVNQ